MSGECDQCGEHALECTCNKDLTCIPSLPIEVKNYFDCKLFHSTVSYFTGKSHWDETQKAWVYEILWLCSEGCDKEILELHRNKNRCDKTTHKKRKTT